MPASDPIAILSQGAVRHLLWLLPLGLALPALKVLLVPLLRGRAGEAQVGAVLDRIGADTLIGNLLLGPMRDRPAAVLRGLADERSDPAHLLRGKGRRGAGARGV